MHRQSLFSMTGEKVSLASYDKIKYSWIRNNALKSVLEIKEMK
jgi:hypothetical protein